MTSVVDPTDTVLSVALAVGRQIRTPDAESMEGTSERHPKTRSSSPEFSRDLKPRKLGFGAWMLSISGVFRVPRIRCVSRLFTVFIPLCYT